jgi:hypothetical protein
MTRLFPPLSEIRDEHIPTAQAAVYLGREPDTLRKWQYAKTEAPITPVRVRGRLMWPTADVRRLLAVEA